MEHPVPSRPAKCDKIQPMRTVGVRLGLIALFLSALLYAQRQDLRPDFSATLQLTVRDSKTGEPAPARVYLFKNGRPFRLSPVDAMLPLRPDLFYRERLWRQTDRPRTLEVTAKDVSHFILLGGEASFDLPAADDYRLEIYRGFAHEPQTVEFALSAEERREIEVTLTALPGADNWIAADDHIHLMRAEEDNETFLGWMEAEDLEVGNFLELQRQQHAAVQYAFGPDGAARRGEYEIRSGHESRSRFYGHTLLLGGEEMIRPLSIGKTYANDDIAYPYPNILFRRGREIGALTGFAHFYGSQPNSTLLLNLVDGSLDFVELFQFGKLHTEDWYELLNAGFRVVGLAGSDFPANIGQFEQWPRALPLLGPERALVKAQAGESPYETWARGVRQGAVTLTNGPLLDFTINGAAMGETIDWQGDARQVEGQATATFHRPIETLEIIQNGKVIARQAGDGKAKTLTVRLDAELTQSAWIAARTTALTKEGEPTIQAHTNPIYFHKNAAPTQLPTARESLRQRWNQELTYYQSNQLNFPSPAEQRSFTELVKATTSAIGR